MRCLLLLLLLFRTGSGLSLARALPTLLTPPIVCPALRPIVGITTPDQLQTFPVVFFRPFSFSPKPNRADPEPAHDSQLTGAHC